MPNKFEISKSNRASCRKCKEKIAKGEVRFGEETIFKRNGENYPNFKWFHFKCAVSKFKSKLAFAEDLALLSNKQQQILDEIQKKASKSKFTFRTLSELDGEEGIINILGIVKRSSKEREMENLDGEMMTGKVVYITDEEDTYIKVTLWNSSSKKLKAQDKLTLLSVTSVLGNDDKAEIHETETSKLFLNEEVALGIQEEIYRSTAWDRPHEGDVEFEYAPSGRAICTVCAEKIPNGTLKVTKPVWGENEQTKTIFPSKNSIHVPCSIKDEDARELLQEAISRLNPQLLSENLQTFIELKDSLKDKELRKMLTSILAY